jgi:hypothetical protein
MVVMEPIDPGSVPTCTARNVHTYHAQQPVRIVSQYVVRAHSTRSNNVNHSTTAGTGEVGRGQH